MIAVFIQQGIMKIPVSAEEAATYGLSYLVWWFVAYGELLGGIGLIIGGLLWKTPAFMHYAMGHNIIEYMVISLLVLVVLYYVAS